MSTGMLKIEWAAQYMPVLAAIKKQFEREKPFKGMKSYTTFDEWYTFKENPRPNVNVLATLDEASIKKFDNIS